ncbi:hypothetical protein BDV96DRAFT_592589 [Lophiotrema nucula]|uniref:Uncharacterized protein n=1 Tax=Lophiotrema nucula TaxID=690887 RepID=A0A6A5YEA6_9PLEO|nr:hypothetical protein BDV96DRAFT_592589 [Lophiotrema nucula]
MYRLRSTLKESIASIKEARELLNTQIKDGPGARSEPLEGKCQYHLETFENKVAGLVSVATKLEEYIELNARYKEAFEAVLTLDDSRASLQQSETSLKQSETSIEQNKISLRQNDLSLEQNVTIQKLTYLTIGYLPMGLMAAIFAIPDEQKVVAKPMGLKWFITGIILLMSITWLLAWKLKPIMQAPRDVWNWLVQRRRKNRDEEYGS